jgi:hypothetical protein
MKRSGSQKRSSSHPPLAAVLGRGDLGGSLLYIFPLFLIYGVGVLSAPAMNGVDFLTRNLYAAVGYSTRNYLLVYGALALVFGVTLLVMRKRGHLHRLPFLGLVLEAGIVALTLGSFIVFVMRSVFHLEGVSILAPELLARLPQLDLPHVSRVSDVILSLGAGVFEELVFRLGLFAGAAALLRLATPLSHPFAMLLSGLISSLVFSAAHHMGALGEPFTWNVFVYRSMAGAVFATIFYYRSLAHAVYTHAFYDVYVGLLR